MAVAIYYDGRRCDGRCHEGDPASSCDCVCKGELHGAAGREGGLLAVINASAAPHVQLNFIGVLNSPGAGAESCG